MTTPPQPSIINRETSTAPTRSTEYTARNSSVKKPKPAFTLAIEEDKVAAQLNPSTHTVLVTFANISPRFLMDRFHPESKNMYNMVVLRDGVPVPETDAMKALAQYRKADRNPTIPHPLVLKPGQALTTSLDVSDYYDMSRPGAYQVTVTRQSQPLNLAYSTLVRSNTTAMIVSPDASASASLHPLQRPQPRFDLDISAEDEYAPPPPEMIRVEMGNISAGVIRIAKCWPFMGMYDLVVTRDGQPVPKTGEMRRLEVSRAAVTCPGNDTLIEIKPGGSYAEDIPIGNFYNVSDPGVYQVYVTRETYPWDPSKSVSVESNTLSFQVPSSQAP
ncbi:MAG: hypothetical protein WAM66_05715 [Acidobacteriaceae bacterium]